MVAVTDWPAAGYDIHHDAKIQMVVVEARDQAIGVSLTTGKIPIVSAARGAAGSGRFNPKGATMRLRKRIRVSTQRGPRANMRSAALGRGAAVASIADDG